MKAELSIPKANSSLVSWDLIEVLGRVTGSNEVNVKKVFCFFFLHNFSPF